MLRKYELIMHPTVYGGEGAMERLRDILTKEHVGRLAVFTDKGIVKTGLLRLPLEQAERCGVVCTVLDDLPAEPSYYQAQMLVDACKDCGADIILAVGGGSVMDTAKLASVLMTDEYGVKELLDMPGRARKSIRTIMIPTTAGTGAEATPNAIVAVPEQQLKVGIVNAEMIADYVILDGEMIRRLPRSIAAATGVDALSHAIECWTSSKANPFSDMFAMRALELILSNIEPACDSQDAMDAKNNMLLASFYAGVAITASGTTAVHALSYPLGGRYHIAHGVSNAILLVPVMRFNEPACRDRLCDVYDRCIRGGASSPEEKSSAVIDRLDGIVKHLNIPTSLRDFGVPPEDIDGLVTAAMQVTRLLVNNPRPLAAADAKTIYRQLF